MYLTTKPQSVAISGLAGPAARQPEPTAAKFIDATRANLRSACKLKWWVEPKAGKRFKGADDPALVDWIAGLQKALKIPVTGVMDLLTAQWLFAASEDQGTGPGRAVYENIWWHQSMAKTPGVRDMCPFWTQVPGAPAGTYPAGSFKGDWKVPGSIRADAAAITRRIGRDPPAPLPWSKKKEPETNRTWGELADAARANVKFSKDYLWVPKPRGDRKYARPDSGQLTVDVAKLQKLIQLPVNGRLDKLTAERFLAQIAAKTNLGRGLDANLQFSKFEMRPNERGQQVRYNTPLAQPSSTDVAMALKEQARVDAAAKAAKAAQSEWERQFEARRKQQAAELEAERKAKAKKKAAKEPPIADVLKYAKPLIPELLVPAKDRSGAIIRQALTVEAALDSVATAVKRKFPTLEGGTVKYVIRPQLQEYAEKLAKKIPKPVDEAARREAYKRMAAQMAKKNAEKAKIRRRAVTGWKARSGAAKGAQAQAMAALVAARQAAAAQPGPAAQAQVQQAEQQVQAAQAEVQQAEQQAAQAEQQAVAAEGAAVAAADAAAAVDTAEDPAAVVQQAADATAEALPAEEAQEVIEEAGQEAVAEAQDAAAHPDAPPEAAAAAEAAAAVVTGKIDEIKAAAGKKGIGLPLLIGGGLVAAFLLLRRRRAA